MTDLQDLKENKFTRPEDWMYVDVPTIDENIIETTIDKIFNDARAQAIEKSEQQGIAVNCEDWNYWRIYAKDIDEKSIGLNLAEMHLLQKYLDDNIKNERSSSLFYGKMLDEIRVFCKNCKQDCNECAINELKMYVDRRI